MRKTLQAFEVIGNKMINNKLRFFFLIICCVTNTLSWGQAPGGRVPINLEFSVTPFKDIYNPGDILTVDVYAYFFRELHEFEENKEILIIGHFTEGSLIQAFKIKPKSNRTDWLHVEVSESTFSDTLIYVYNTSDEIHGSFKILVKEKFSNLQLRAVSYVLGEEYFNNKLISPSIIINGIKKHYIGVKHHNYHKYKE